MEALIACLTNWKTTIGGFIIGGALYVVANGVKMPTDAQGWWTFAFAVLVAGYGFVSKDATTGSRPSVILLPLLAVALTGCTALYGQMTPDQLAALSKVKDAHAGCTIINSPYGRGVVVWANSDRGVLGKLTIDGECKVSIEGPAPKP